MFTLAEARDLIASMRPQLDEVIAVRADLAELRADLYAHESSSLGGIAEAKAFEARIFAALSGMEADGVQIKGYAPLLIDLPGERDGVDVLWCWLEGDETIVWYHRADCGFAGRRRV